MVASFMAHCPHIYLMFILEGHRYRWWDHLVTLRLIPVITPLVYRWKKSSIPKSLRDQAMGIESLFK